MIGGWVLQAENSCSYNKNELGHRNTQQGDCVRTRGEDNCLQAKERGFRGNQACWHLGLRLPGSSPWEKNSSLVYLDLWVLSVSAFLFLRLWLVKSEESIVRLLFISWDGASPSGGRVVCRGVCPELGLAFLRGRRRRKDSDPGNRVWENYGVKDNGMELELIELSSLAHSFVQT